jgi:hypothetical protein
MDLLESEVTKDFPVLDDIIDDDKCVACKEYYIVRDNKCSYCINNINKCILCKLYYAPKNGYHCSECSLILKYIGKELTVKEIIDLPDSSFKSKKMDENLEALFNLYKLKNSIQNSLIKNQNLFESLLKSCKGKHSGEVFCILDGQKDSKPVMLYANQAKQLLDQMYNSYDDESWKYIHAIAPFIFDVWNILPDYNILECYYKDLGSLTECPKSLDDLHKLWDRPHDRIFTYNLTNCNMDDCKICKSNIRLHDKNLIKCKYCHSHIHLHCGAIEVATYCQYCGEKWKLVKLGPGNYESFWVIN